MGRSMTGTAKVIIGIPAGQLKIELEQASPPGKQKLSPFSFGTPVVESGRGIHASLSHSLDDLQRFSGRC